MIAVDIGSGDRPRLGYITIDVNAGLNPDICASAEYLPLRPCSTDRVYFSHVIEHLPNPMKALREIRHTLKLFGDLILIGPNGAFPWTLYSEWKYGNKDNVGGRHLWIVTPKSLRTALEGVEFTLESAPILAHERHWGIELAIASNPLGRYMLCGILKVRLLKRLCEWLNTFRLNTFLYDHINPKEQFEIKIKAVRPGLVKQNQRLYQAGT